MHKISVPPQKKKAERNTESENKKVYTKTLNAMLPLLIVILNISPFPAILTVNGKVHSPLEWKLYWLSVAYQIGTWRGLMRIWVPH